MEQLEYELELAAEAVAEEHHRAELRIRELETELDAAATAVNAAAGNAPKLGELKEQLQKLPDGVADEHARGLESELEAAALVIAESEVTLEAAERARGVAEKKALLMQSQLATAKAEVLVSKEKAEREKRQLIQQLAESNGEIMRLNGLIAELRQHAADKLGGEDAEAMELEKVKALAEVQRLEQLCKYKGEYPTRSAEGQNLQMKLEMARLYQQRLDEPYGGQLQADISDILSSWWDKLTGSTPRGTDSADVHQPQRRNTAVHDFAAAAKRGYRPHRQRGPATPRSARQTIGGTLLQQAKKVASTEESSEDSPNELLPNGAHDWAVTPPPRVGIGAP